MKASAARTLYEKHNLFFKSWKTMTLAQDCTLLKVRLLLFKLVWYVHVIDTRTT